MLSVISFTTLSHDQRCSSYHNTGPTAPRCIALRTHQENHTKQTCGTRGTRSSDILQDLHWLPIDKRIEFKIATLTYNILNSSQPGYLRSLLNYHSPIRSLRFANTNLLSVPRVRTTFASSGFSIAAPAVWNSLPSSIRSSTSADTFRRLLKTHCFQQAYCSP